MFDEPSYQQKMNEAMEAAAEKARQEEPSSVRSARVAHEQAQAHLEKVKTARGADGRLWYTYQERGEAEKDVEAKKKAYWAAENEHLKQQRLKKLEDDKKATEAKWKADEAKTLAENEGRLRESMRARFPGSDAEFLEAWPELKRQHYIRSTLDGEDRARAGHAAMLHGVY